MKSLTRFLILQIVLFSFQLQQNTIWSQTPGTIYNSAVLPNIMDPNSDGFITSTGLAFTASLSDDQDE
ncbi:MAG: hypothetical protein HKP28_09745, partial [Winogradskyella sp.]|nr:hypothetical protein [Winogradskyella sp.]